MIIPGYTKELVYFLLYYQRLPVALALKTT